MSILPRPLFGILWSCDCIGPTHNCSPAWEPDIVLTEQNLDVDDKAVDLALMRIDQHQVASEASATQIARYHRADRAGARAGADQCNGSRVE